MMIETQINPVPVIELRGVSKRFGQRQVLSDVNLVVPAGHIYGISGPNGTGKSILLRIISGLVYADAGEVIVFGERIGREAEFPRNTGALIDGPGFLPHYSGSRNLQLLAMIRNQITREEIAATLRKVGLDPDDSRPVKTYSTGMRQRLGIAQALMEKPKLLLLDEPTNGLDLDGIHDTHRLLKEMKANGVTILLTSHSREEIRELCDAAFSMDKGHLERSSITPSNTSPAASPPPVDSVAASGG